VSNSAGPSLFKLLDGRSAYLSSCRTTCAAVAVDTDGRQIGTVRFNANDEHFGMYSVASVQIDDCFLEEGLAEALIDEFEDSYQAIVFR